MTEYSFHPFRGGEALTEYATRYRRSDLPLFDVGQALDLYPSRPRATAFVPQLTWQHPWPYADRAGVYLFFDDAHDLFYIGKASMSRCLGQRLYEYFGGGDVCTPKFDWLQPARYVITVGMSPELPFEAPSLEEFL